MSIIDEPSTLKILGDLVIIKTNKVDNTTNTYKCKNLIVSVGKTNIAARMSGNTAAVMSHMAVGTGNSIASLGDTTLESELSRVSLTVQGGTPSTNNITYSAIFPAGVGTGSLEEAGVFNALTSGAMMCRTVFPSINKQASDSITITWTITIV